jgi:glutamate--cysteine ligase catalytic subunit
MQVEQNMRLRRCRLHSALKPNEIAPSSGNFPLLGTCGLKSSLSEDCGGNDGFVRIPITRKNRLSTKQNEGNHKSDISGSAYVDDDVINPHPRFTTLTRNIRDRRGSKVDINIADADNVNAIHMDAMAFGMGCCCLQVTMQCPTDRESRYLHDQLAVLAPLFLALSASTPIHKGKQHVYSFHK